MSDEQLEYMRDYRHKKTLEQQAKSKEERNKLKIDRVLKRTHAPCYNCSKNVLLFGVGYKIKDKGIKKVIVGTATCTRCHKTIKFFGGNFE